MAEQAEKCPYCGKEMKAGYLLGNATHSPFFPGEFFWQDERKRKPFSDRWHLEAEYDGFPPLIPVVPAQRCDDCGKVILSARIKEYF